MHETGTIRDLVRRLEQAAQSAGARRVSGVRVWLGALTLFSAEHFREHFAVETRGTIVEGATLQIDLSDDVVHPNAQNVMISSIDLEVPRGVHGVS